MKAKRFGLFVASAGLLLLSVPLIAHHGAASFDIGAEVTLKGTVTEWTWFNPHCFLKFDVKGEDGTVKNWAVEAGNPTDPDGNDPVGVRGAGLSEVHFQPDQVIRRGGASPRF